MKPFFALLALWLAGAFGTSWAQSPLMIATCPSAAPGASFGSVTYPGCGAGAATYLPLSSLNASSIVADLRGSSGSWQLATNVQAGDQVYTNTLSATHSFWTPAGPQGFPLSTAPPVTPPVIPPVTPPVTPPNGAPTQTITCGPGANVNMQGQANLTVGVNNYTITISCPATVQ